MTKEEMMERLFVVWDMAGIRVEHYYQDRRDIYEDVGMVVILYMNDFVEVTTLVGYTDGKVAVKKKEWRGWKYYDDYEEAYIEALGCI